MGRNVAIAIGVGDAKPLEYLSGAVNGARAFHAWASQLGYESKLLTDEDKEVTVQRLRSELDGLLDPQRGPIHRLIVYFAGHGLIREAEEGLWLLADWRSEGRGVAIEGLKRRLCKHDIQQIAIFSDSCRSLPKNMVQMDLDSISVLGSGPNRDQKPPAIDRYTAAQDGSETFMVRGKAPEEDRCIFSGVLMEALWGTKPAAFSVSAPNKITSQSLRKYLESEVPELAQRYGQKLEPMCIPTFPEGDDIYFPEGVPPRPPTFAPWPDPDSLSRTELMHCPTCGLELLSTVMACHMCGTRITRAIAEPVPSGAVRLPGRAFKRPATGGPPAPKRAPKSLIEKIQSQKRPQ